MRRFCVALGALMLAGILTGCGESNENANALPAQPPPDAGQKAVDQMKTGGGGPMAPPAEPKK